MISVQKAIFPGITFGCIFLVFITSLIANPTVSLASSLPVTPTRASLLPETIEEQPPTAEKAAVDLPEAGDQMDLAQPTAEEQVVADMPADVSNEAPQVESVEEDVSQECSLNGGYPEAILQWCGLIEKYAGENGIEPNLVAAVMLQESGGNADAYSKSGAVGLMQVMPRDGLAASFMCVNGPCFSARPSMDELFDPEFNVRYGVNMLAGLIRKHGDVREGLRAYGPMNYGYRYADLVLSIKARYE